LHQLSSDPLYLGDSTSNEAILFSPALYTSSPPAPSYPNYTLPSANRTLSAPPSWLAASNFSLAIFPTSSSPISHKPLTGCALKAAANGTGNILNQTLWQRDMETWRNEWLVGGLTPLTNYTVFSIVNGTRVSGPSYFETKSGKDPCTRSRLCKS
jgi:calcium channel MID1